MLKKSFETAQFIKSSNVPTILAYDTKLGLVVIGESARNISSAFRPIVQDFKHAIGNTDPYFEGRFISNKGARPQKTWELRFDGPEVDRFISTRELTKVYLQQFFAELGEIPQQLVIGTPSSKDAAWLTLYRAHMKDVLKELGYPDTQFFPEPFAVFQYYRHVEKLIPESHKPLSVLVIDFGGGTLDSCIIETTPEGNLSRGGSTALPLGVKSFVGAGKEIDRRLLKIAIGKSSNYKLRQDSIESRITSRPWILLFVEEMKIALSRKLEGAIYSDDCSIYIETRELPLGAYHPDFPVTLELTGQDLKQVLSELWGEKNGIGATIVATISEAKHRGGQVRLQSLDKVILAGGSSRLPFLRDLLITTMTGQILVKPEDILIGKNTERAVAYGIAIEAAEERNRALRTHNSIGPCVFNELYIYFAPRRREKAVMPKINSRQGGKNLSHPHGVLMSGPMRVDDFTLEYAIELPFRPHASLVYWFCDRADIEDPETDRLNVQQDTLRLPTKAANKFGLRITFDAERGMVAPAFIFNDETFSGVPFSFGGLRFQRDVRSYLGLDFGTSNSYAVTLWAAPKERQSKYPVFKISQAAGERLRLLEIKIAEAKEKGVLTRDSARDYSRREQANFVFHSVKLEGNSLTRGETEALLDGSKAAISKQMLEPLNVRDAYDFCLENYEALKQTPEAFIRELHKMVLLKIESDGGVYRKEQVIISGMAYAPPDWTDVEPFMSKLATELRDLDPKKTALQNAAEIHSKFTSIHPFTDGNGRTARLIMNAVLIETGLPAIVIAHSDKARYLDGLASSNKGDISELCMLFAEALESSLEQLGGNVGSDDGIDLLGIGEPVITGWVPSQDLADLMRSRVERAPIELKSRYEAWAAAFDSLREDFRLTCLGFNEQYGGSLYHTELTDFDRLPFEKYEDLLRRKPVPKTWLMGIEVGSDRQSEKFVFWFRQMSAEFRDHCLEKHPTLTLPPREVTLGLSRRVQGTFQPLNNEPIQLREMAYIDGEWIAFLYLSDESLGIQRLNSVRASQMFLRDAIATFL